MRNNDKKYCCRLSHVTQAYRPFLKAMSITWTTGVLLSVFRFMSLGEGCVLGIVGESAVLPCIYNGTDDLAIVNVSIEWRKGSEVVHSSVLGEKSQVTQMSYGNRTQLLRDVVQTRDFSLLISDVTVTDAQNYSGYITRPGVQNSTHLCTVCLIAAAHFTHPVLLSAAGAVGEEARFICHSRGGFPEPRVHWFINEKKRPPVDAVHTLKTLLPNSTLYNITSVLSINLTQDFTVSCAVENLILNETLASASYGVQASPVVGRASQAMWMFSTSLCVIVGLLVAIALGYQIKHDYNHRRKSAQDQVELEYSTDDERKEIILEQLDSLTETNV
ncbi:hypothetical protein AAFF_G00311400 [Aldrovandia affinis]|uniref:Ig-like domain-containing protein n=1 Tax=Aldrovandia affinis TaxID=143900 RepID=A0AAD7VZY1_9TELE|nr:hypothetical protein AAFF_G00311400 [Aldrovandia affinis]